MRVATEAEREGEREGARERARERERLAFSQCGQTRMLNRMQVSMHAVVMCAYMYNGML